MKLTVKRHSHEVDATTFKIFISLAIKEELELYDPLKNDNL